MLIEVFGNRDGIGQLEGKPGLILNHGWFAFAEQNRAGAGGSARAGANGRALAASGECPDNRAQSRTAGHLDYFFIRV
jgi:hypothetical protein